MCYIYTTYRIKWSYTRFPRFLLILISLLLLLLWKMNIYNGECSPNKGKGAGL